VVGGGHAPAVRLACACFLWLLAGSAVAQAPVPQTAEDDGGAPVAREEPDPTRLDVERLPPEAIAITRDLYAHGFLVEAYLGARGFVNGAGDVTTPGPWASIRFGYEILDWLMVLLGVEGSMHQTDAPAPPAQGAFELVQGTVDLRVQIHPTAEFAIWLDAQFGLLVATTDLLVLYGFEGSDVVGITYGGELGLDWHLRSRHHSIGVMGGVRHYPSLEATNGTAPALGVHGAAYIRYVF
jgi:hypothetical protein